MEHMGNHQPTRVLNMCLTRFYQLVQLVLVDISASVNQSHSFAILLKAVFSKNKTYPLVMTNIAIENGHL